jgi:hypothetical protein
MCHHDRSAGCLPRSNACGCACASQPGYLGKTKRIEALQRQIKELDAQANDLREYLKELEAAR